MHRSEKSRGSGKAFSIIFRGTLIGFTLGLILAVLAGSIVWLEMRVPVGLAIPATTILCPVFVFWKKKELPYSLFLAGQLLLVVSLFMIYGSDTGALWSVPAYLFREGFHQTGLPPGTAGLMVGGIFIGGNLLWTTFSN